MWKTIRGEGEGDGRPLGPDRRERGRKASESEPFPQSLIFFIQPIFHWPVQLASHLNSRYLCVTLFPCFPSSWFISFFPFFQLFGTQRKRERRVRMCGSYIRALLGSKDERTSSLFYIPIITSEMCNKEPPIYVHWCLQHCGWIDGERQTHYLHIRGQSLPPWIFVNWNSQELSTSLAAAVPCSERN